MIMIFAPSADHFGEAQEAIRNNLQTPVYAYISKTTTAVLPPAGCQPLLKQNAAGTDPFNWQSHGFKLQLG